MKIVILTENTVYRQGILAEHGLSLFIEEKGKKYLFDTGQSDVFLKNAEKLHIDLENLDGVILSHGHYDHCGGFPYYAKEYGLPKVYVRESAFAKKYHQAKENCREIGIAWDRKVAGEHLVYTKELEEISKDVFLAGNIPFKNEFEAVAEGMLVEAGGKRVLDTMSDEQMLVIRNENGLNVFLGCSHAGIINALTYVEQIFPEEHIHLLFAGMHLSAVSDERLKKTIDEIKKRNIDIVIPVHCTGIMAMTAMKQQLGDSCKIVHAGKILNQI